MSIIQYMSSKMDKEPGHLTLINTRVVYVCQHTVYDSILQYSRVQTAKK